MLAYTYIKQGKFELIEKPKPELRDSRDAIVRVTLGSICTSDLHIKHGGVPRAVPGITVGHEMVGIVEQTGRDVKLVKPGDRVTVNVETFCGECFFCRHRYVNNCADPNGGWALGCRIDGGQTEYVRVPYADQGLNLIPDSVSDEQALFVGDILATGFWAAFIIVAVAVVVFAVAFVMLAGYRSTRIEAWLHPETAGTDAVFQTMMGLYAIGSGGLFGKGLGESLQKLGNVPESQNDMIFTIICEELGLFGAICLILLFILLIWRMMVIANNARDLYGSLLVIGVMSHIAIQVILNIAVVTNSLPNTGVILPFISYGGTSIIFLMAEIGLVLSVSRGIRLENV